MLLVYYKNLDTYLKIVTKQYLLAIKTKNETDKY